MAAQAAGSGKLVMDRKPASRLVQLRRRYGNRAVERLYAARRAGRLQREASDEENGSCTCGRMVRREASGEDEEPVCRAVQTKLTLSSPEDPSEQEAEQVAQEVTSFHAAAGSAGLDMSLLSRISVPRVMGLGSLTQRSFQSVQSAGRKPRIFARAEHGTSEGTVSPEIEARIQQGRGAGQPLPRHVHNLMSLRTGYDFSAVRVKTGPEAAELNDRLHARAFTLGSDIWMGKNESPDDISLMSHELTHVVQQGAAQRVSPVSTAAMDGLRAKSGVMA